MPKHLPALACLLALAYSPAHAQTAIPTSGAPVVLIPRWPNGQPLTSGIRYQVQGTGWACVSWGSSNFTISGTDGTAKCSGQAFLVGPLAGDNRLFPGGLPGGPLYGIGAAGSSLQIVWEAY